MKQDNVVQAELKAESKVYTQNNFYVVVTDYSVFYRRELTTNENNWIDITKLSKADVIKEGIIKSLKQNLELYLDTVDILELSVNTSTHYNTVENVEVKIEYVSLGKVNTNNLISEIEECVSIYISMLSKL